MEISDTGRVVQLLPNRYASTEAINNVTILGAGGINERANLRSSRFCNASWWSNSVKIDHFVVNFVRMFINCTGLSTLQFCIANVSDGIKWRFHSAWNLAPDSVSKSDKSKARLFLPSWYQHHSTTTSASPYLHLKVIYCFRPCTHAQLWLSSISIASSAGLSSQCVPTLSPSGTTQTWRHEASRMCEWRSQKLSREWWRPDYLSELACRPRQRMRIRRPPPQSQNSWWANI